LRYLRPAFVIGENDRVALAPNEGLSVREVTRRVGVSANLVSQIERDKIFGVRHANDLFVAIGVTACVTGESPTGVKKRLRKRQS
jgi:transcriptional regulator with XRE-family HTH domain